MTTFKETDLVLHRARLLTLSPLGAGRTRGGPDGAVVATGHGNGWERLDLVPGATVEDAGGRVVMPGFVDPHTHLCYAGERWDEFAARRSGSDYLATLGRGGAIHATVRST